MSYIEYNPSFRTLIYYLVLPLKHRLEHNQRRTLIQNGIVLGAVPMLHAVWAPALLVAIALPDQLVRRSQDSSKQGLHLGRDAGPSRLPVVDQKPLRLPPRLALVHGAACAHRLLEELA